jgi:hypothetical protein
MASALREHARQMTRTFLAAVSIAWWTLGMGGAIGQVDAGQPAAFGPRIIDLSLDVDDAARHSLQAAPESAVPATMTFQTIGDGDQVYNVMVHVKGQLGSARPFDDKPAFKIKLGKGERFLGLEQLTLNNMVQDPTMLHEALGYQVYATAGVAVPDTGYVRLTVNGHAYGLYLNVETIDPLFLTRRFGDDAGILYEGNYGVDLRAGDETKFQLHEGHDPDHAQLASLIKAVDAPGDGVFYGATARVDTASFLSMMAVEALLADWDNYYQSNNYRIYWNPLVGRWSFIPTGIDQTFGGDSTTVFGATGLLFQKCLAFERCTKDYADAVREVAVRFERLGLGTKMDALLSVIDAASQADLKKPYDARTMKTAREAMHVFIATRPNDVRAALSCIDGGHEATLAACVGAVAVNPASDGCMELVSRSPDQNGAGVRVARCLGGVKQRWRLVATGDAFELEAISTGNCLEVSNQGQDDGTPMQQAACSGTDSQLFSLRPGSQDTQIVARHSGKCVAIAPGDVKTPPLIQATCAQEANQTWRVQRSIFR